MGPSRNRVMQFFEYDKSSGQLLLRERSREEFSNHALWSRHVNNDVGRVAGCPNSDGYIKVHMDGTYYSAHRIAWLIMTGDWPEYPAWEIDHVNGDRGDNRWSNLRKVSKSENQRNGGKRANNTSGVHGVSWKPKYNKTEGDGRWVARIWSGPKHVYLGAFKTLHEAAIARKAAERALGFTGTDREPFEAKKSTGETA